MTRMTRPDCAVMCNLINTHTHITHTHTQRDRNSTSRSGSRRRGGGGRGGRGAGGRGGGVGAGVLDSENNGSIRWQPSLMGRLS